MNLLWLLLWGIGFNCAQYLDKPPPTIQFSRNWNVIDTTPVGSVVSTVGVSEAEKREGEIIYGLEHAIGENIVQSEPGPLPFNINQKTGDVYTNQSLKNWGGRDLVLFITARYANSYLPAKYQVWVRIEKSGVKKSTATHPNFSKPSFVPYFKTNVEKHRPPVTKLVNSNSTANLDDLQDEIEHDDNVVDEETHIANESIAIYNIGSNNNQDEEDESELYKSSTVISTGKNAGGDAKPMPTDDVAKWTIVLIVMAVIGSSFLVFGCVYLFRKKLCYHRHKVNNDDMKKSSLGMVSLDESMVLQNWKRVRTLSNRHDSWDSGSNHNQTAITLNLKCNDKWELPRHHIKVFSILGEGCFGQVWKCEATNIDDREGPTVVAVKMLKENAGEHERNDILQELQVMKMLEPHPNVVRLLGCCTDRDPIFVIMEYVPNGKLQSYLRHSRAQRYYNNLHGSSNTLTSQDLTMFCYQIAKGMQYLSSKGIIHRDLAARNILIGENRTCKIADFGFARDIVTSHIYERKSEGRLPIRWMAPESLYDNIFSVKSDAWSFGILIWEIVTLGSTPYPGIAAAEVMKRVRDGYRLDKPEHCRRELYIIMYYCWNRDPNLRPSFGELVDLLEQLLLTETDYIQLDKFPDHSYYNMISLSEEKL